MLHLGELMKKKNHFISEIWAINPQKERKAVAKTGSTMEVHKQFAG